MLRPSPVNYAEVLWLIREGKVGNLSDLYKYYRVSENKYFTHSPEFNTKFSIDHAIAQLGEAGLIEIKKVETAEAEEKDPVVMLKPTALINQVQEALNISLSELARWDDDCIFARPMFGIPKKKFEASDVFVLMPFSDELQPIYEDHIRKVVKLLEERNKPGQKISVARADNFFKSQSIVSDIWNSIYRSKVLIADCTGRNPNVFYEIGIAHTIGRPVILLSQSLKDIPFDLKHLRYIIYEYTPRGMARFEDLLFKALEAELPAL